MLELLRDAITANQAEAATYPEGVILWMRVMAMAYLSSVAFVIWKSGARWVLFALVVNVVSLVMVRAAFPDFTRHAIGTGTHLVFWSLALFMVWRPGVKERREDDFKGPIGALYRVWLIMVSLIMATSLLLDAWSVLRVFT